MEKLKILIVTMLPLLAGACRLNGGKEIIDTPPQEDTLEVKNYLTDLTVDAPCPVRSLDIFVYRADGLRDLEVYLHADSDCATVSLSDTLPKMVAVVANARGRFNPQGLSHYDSLGEIRAQLGNDSPDAPLMSGIGQLGRPVPLTPLLCTVELVSVANYYGGDVLAENPRVWLENVNTDADIFRNQGFTVRDPSASRKVYLPSDIGLYTQHPGTKLYCYPNDLPNPDAGNPATELVLEYEIEGVTLNQRYTLHPILRGETIQIEAEIRPYGAGRP